MTKDDKFLDKLGKLQWKLIVLNGESTDYEVNEFGTVRNIRRGRIISPSKLANGDLQVTLFLKDKSCSRKIHDLVAHAFLDNPDKRSKVRHINGNRADNRVENLEWAGPHKGKRSRKFNPFKVKIGSEAAAAKYDEYEIANVCHLLSEGKLSVREIAKETGVSIPVINNVRARRSWNQVSQEFRFTSKPGHLRGTEVGTNVYTPEEIHVVCNMLKRGISNKHIAEKTNVNPKTISQIKKGHSWRHISEQYGI